VGVHTKTTATAHRDPSEGLGGQALGSAFTGVASWLQAHRSHGVPICGGAHRSSHRCAIIACRRNMAGQTSTAFCLCVRSVSAGDPNERRGCFALDLRRARRPDARRGRWLLCTAVAAGIMDRQGRMGNDNVIGGRVQQADAADGARRFGAARFARQSSLMRAPQLIRGVRRTLGGACDE